MTDPARFVDVMRLAALQAGAVASRLQGQVRLERKPREHSPEGEALTAVDLATQEVVLRLLRHELPDVAVDAEEDTESVAAFPPPAPGRDLVVLDPIDGTLNYARGSLDYAVMGALVRDGRFVAAVIHFPAHGRTFHAVRGGGCFLDTTRVHVDPGALGDTVLMPPRHDPWRRGLEAAGFEPVPSRCSAVDSAAPAIGRAVASISWGHADRRRALGFLLTTEAGGVVRFGDRRWDGEDPDTFAGSGPCVAAASDDLADRVLAAVGG